MTGLIFLPQQLQDSYFIESNDKIRFFYEAGAVGPDGKLQVEPSLSLNKVSSLTPRTYCHPLLGIGLFFSTPFLVLFIMHN